MKRIFSVLAVLAISLFVTSCSVESKTKSFFERQAEYEINTLELEIAEAEKMLEYYEYVADMSDEDFAEWAANNEDWEEDVENEYKDKLEELEELQEDLEDKASDMLRDLGEND